MSNERTIIITVPRHLVNKDQYWRLFDAIEHIVFLAMSREKYQRWVINKNGDQTMAVVSDDIDGQLDRLKDRLLGEGIPENSERMVLAISDF